MAFTPRDDGWDLLVVSFTSNKHAVGGKGIPRSVCIIHR